MINKIDNVVDMDLDMDEELLATKKDIRELNERLERNFEIVVDLIKQVQKQIQDNYIVPKNTLPHLDVEVAPKEKQEKIKIEALDGIMDGYAKRYTS